MNDDYPVETVGLTTPRKKVLTRFLLVWVISCLLVAAYAALVYLLEGTPNWLDVVIFSGWVFVSGTWLITLPELKWTQKTRRIFWLIGLTILLVLLFTMVFPWALSPTPTLIDEIPSLLLIPQFLEDWLLDLIYPIDLSTNSPTFILASLLFITGTGLVLTCISVIWQITYLGLKPFVIRSVHWLVRQWKRLEEIPFWVLVKRLVQGSLLIILGLIIVGLILSAQPAHTIRHEILETKGFPKGRLQSIKALVVGPDGASLFAGTEFGRVYRSDDDGASWQLASEGLKGSGVNALAVGPGSESLFAGTDGDGVYRSDDLGVSWQSASEGLENLDVEALVVGPDGASILAVGQFGGVHRSDDLGASWQPATEGLKGSDVNALAVGLDGGSIYSVDYDNVVYRTNDFGESWQLVNEGPDSTMFVTSLALGPDGRSLFAGTGSEVFRSNDLGASWQRANEGLNGFGVNVFALGSDGKSIFAGTDGGVFRYDNQGADWEPVNQGISSLSVNALVLGPDGKSLFAGTDNGVYRSRNLRASWQLVSEGIDTILQVNALVEGPDGKSLFAGTPGGVFRSDDLGASWRSANWGLSGLVAKSLLVGPDGASIFAITQNGGVYRSDDLGANWQPASEGLDPFGADIFGLGVDGGSIYAISYNGIYRTNDLGESWQRINEDPFYSMRASNLVVVPGGESLIISSFDGIFRSDDQGVNWKIASEDLVGHMVNALVAGPDGGSLFAGTSRGVFRSDDLGTSWQSVGEGLGNSGATALAVGPDGASLFVGADFGRVYRSDDLGASWQLASEGVNGSDVIALVVGADGKSLFAATNSGVFRSDNLGVSWHPVNQGLSGLGVNVLAIGPDGTSLFAGANNGTYRSEDFGVSWQPVGEGLSDVVNAFAVGPDGRSLFIGTNDGVYRSDATGSSWQLASEKMLITNVNALTVGPDGRSLFAGTGFISGGVFRSDDLGESWQPANQGIEGTQVNALSIGPDGESIFAANLITIYRSNDLGVSWQPVNQGLSNLEVMALRLGIDGETLFAGNREGVYYLHETETTWRPLGIRWSPSSGALSRTSAEAEYRKIFISRPGIRYGFQLSNPLNTTQVYTIDQERGVITLISLNGPTQLIREELSVPLFWTLPDPVINLVKASWQTLFWIFDNRVPVSLLVGLATSFAGVYVYSAIIRPNKIRPRLAIWLIRRWRHLLASIGYRRYLSRWDSTRPLEQFIWLFSRTLKPFTIETIVPALRNAGVVCDSDEVDLALRSLGRYGIIQQEVGMWSLVEPLLANVLFHDLGPNTLGKLAEKIRLENPLYVETRNFLSEAEFDLVPQGDFGFVAENEHPMWVSVSPLYVHVVMERRFDAVVVREIQQAIRHLEKPQAGSNFVLATIDRPPQAADLYQIFATRVQNNLTIVPMPLSMMRQARIDNNVPSTLNTQINQYTGQEDLYDVKTAVSDVLSFFGRHKLLIDLEKRLTSGRSMMVYGVRKIGKSSLLHRLREQSGWPTAIVDAEGYAGGMQYIFSEAVRDWRAIITTEYPKVDLQLQEFDGSGDLSNQIYSFRQAVGAMLNSLSQLTGKPGLLLFIDEMEYLYQKDTDLFSELASALRSIAENAQWRGRFALLVAGLHSDLNRQDALAGSRNPFFSFFEETPLGPLDLEDARTMIISLGGQMGIDYSDDALDCLVQIGGGHPLLTRQLCHYAIGGRQERPLTIENADAQKAIQAYLWDPANYLAKSIWPSEGNPLSRHEAEILKMLAEKSSSLEADLFPSELTPEEAGIRKEALAKLRGVSLIRQDSSDRWTLTIPLYERWIRQTQLNLLDE